MARHVKVYYVWGLLLACLIGSGVVLPVQAQNEEDVHAMVLSLDDSLNTINRHIYGHFAEHLGRDIYGGFWVQDDAGQWGLNEPIIEALRRINPPNVRWPGGCFADYYHWRDGIGPREERPRMVNTLWGGVTEDNSFGTHEFMSLVEALDTEAVVVGNVGSGTVEEMAEWWEYMNHPGGSTLAEERAANGHPEPWNVRFWGVGNESWGCGGTMTPSYYSDLYRRFATFLRPFGPETEPFRIATGPAGSDYEWMDTVMREAGSMIDGIDLHHYTVVNSWASKGSATDFGERLWHQALIRAMETDTLLTRHSAIMDRYDPENRVWLIVGEWGMWHDVEPGTNPGFLFQQNTLRDAIVAALSFDTFHKHSERVRMANIAQTINVLQAMILTDPDSDRFILTPTYHIFDMYQVHQDAARLAFTLDAGTYTYDGRGIPALSASASRDASGRVHVSLTNLDPNQARTVHVDLRGGMLTDVRGQVLTAGAINAHNTFDAPDVVRPVAFDDATLEGNQLTVVLPAKSVVVLELN